MTGDEANGVADWWSKNPQTYGDKHGRALYDGEQRSLGERAFFDDADHALFEWNTNLHDKEPFDLLFPFDRFREKRVLEIGCGMGAMASLWAKHAALVTAIDLAPFSIEMTRRRFSLMGLQGRILEADGRNLAFDDGEFDYVYSWGVLHHSPSLDQSLREMMRVLKPGGEFGLMLYHRHSLLYLWRIRYREGFVHFERRFLDPVQLSSRYTDASEAEGNPHTWPVTQSEVRQMLAPYTSNLQFRVLGMEVDHILNTMLPGVGRVLPQWALRPWARRLGWSLWAQGTRA